MSALQQEMKSRQDTSLDPAHDVSSILQILLKDGPLRTNIPKLSAFSGERANGGVSFEQWGYKLQILRKSYSDSALREGIQHSLRGAATDTIHNMGSSVPTGHDYIKNTIVFGNVKSFDLLKGYLLSRSRGRKRPFLPSPIDRGTPCPKSGIGSQTSSPTRRNRDS